MVSITMYATGPDGKGHRRYINSSHHTMEECDEVIREYRKWVRSGHNPKSFDIPATAENYRKNLLVKIPDTIKETTEELFETMHLKDLDIDKSLGGSSFAVIGSTKSGKSYATNFIVKEFYHKHITFLMSLTSHGKVYDPFRSKGIIAEKFCPELIEEAFIINKKTNNHYDFLFVFDDLALDGKNDTTMTKLLTTGRNIGCSAIISGQKATMLSATGRSNCNYACLFKQNSLQEIESSIKTWLRSYFPRGMSIPDIVRLYQQYTEDHHFFLVDTLNNKCYLSRV
jgi:hypothetical protein